VENRALRRLTQWWRIAAWKTSAEDNARGFRECLDVLAKEKPNEFQDGSLAGSRTAREDDPAWHVAVTAVAGFHSVCSIVTCVSPSPVRQRKIALEWAGSQFCRLSS
jgi:hypothetical protein